MRSFCTRCLTRRLIVPIAAVLVLALGGTLFMLVGRDFFPIIDGGQIQLHVRAPAGTRIEKTEQIFQAVEDKIREVIPEDERESIVDNIGLPHVPTITPSATAPRPASTTASMLVS